MREKIVLSDDEEVEIVDRTKPTCRRNGISLTRTIAGSSGDGQFRRATDTMSPGSPMISGLSTMRPDEIGPSSHDSFERSAAFFRDPEAELYQTDDAEITVVAYGSVAVLLSEP